MGMRDIPVPEIGPDDVLVQMKAAGVCSSDLLAQCMKLYVLLTAVELSNIHKMALPHLGKMPLLTAPEIGL